MQQSSPAVGQSSQSNHDLTRSTPAFPNMRWNLATRIAFRFASAFLLLIIIPFPFYAEDAPDVLPSLWHRVVPWVASHLSHFSPPQILANYELYGYFQLLTYLLVAAVTTIFWSLADRKRQEYTALHEWLRLYLRIYLAFVIFSYGSSKLFPEQFRTPSLARLLQPFGDYDRSGLMWNFMGVSRAYTLFAGSVEALAGILLFIPRFRTVGALLCGAALTNVFVLDMGYDISGPRIFCFILLLMCGFLLAADVRRLADFFVLNRKVEPDPPRPLFQRRWLNMALLAAQLIYGMYAIGTNLAADRRNSRVRDQALLQNPLRGIWAVDEFHDDHQLRPPLVTDPVRWQRVVIDSPPSATLQSGVINLLTIQSMNGSLHSLPMEVDLAHNTLLLRKEAEDKAWIGRFRMLRPAAETLVLEGLLEGRPIEAKLHLTHPQFKLTSYRFRWLRDRPLDPWTP